MEFTSSLKYLQKNYIYFGIFMSCIMPLLVGVITFLKYATRRVNYSKTIPTKQMKFFDMWGSIAYIIFSARDKNLSLQTYLLQAFAGYYQLFKKESVFYVWCSFSPVLVVTKAKAAEQLIGGSRNMEKGWVYQFAHPWLGTGLPISHGAKWKTRRKLLAPSFHFDTLKEFLPVFNEQAEILVKLLEKETKKPWIDIITPVTLCSLDIICETILGTTVRAQVSGESEYVKAVQRASESIMNRMINPFEWPNWFYFNITKRGRQQKKDLKLLHDFTLSIISQKKKILLSGGDVTNQGRKRKALMDLLLEHHIENQTLTEEDVREEIDSFTFAGHDTTSMGMSWALYLIGLYKHVQENIHEELDIIFGNNFERPITIDDLRDMPYLERVLKESQRLYPSAPLIARTLNNDISLCGRKIPKDAMCVLLTYCLHRDESVFPNPEKFDPDRFLPENTAKRHPFAYLPFSAGHRNCIGQRFAVMEEKVVIASILRNYTLESLDQRDKVIPAVELVLSCDGPIRMKLTSRKH